MSDIKWNGLTNEDFLENIEIARKKMRPAKLADVQSNGAAILRWLLGHKTTPTGVDGSVEAIQQCFYALLYTNELEWDVRPRTQKDVREQDEAKRVEPLSVTDVIRQNADARAAAVIMAECRRQSQTTTGRSHYQTGIIREGLTAFLDNFLVTNKIEKITRDQANAFQVLFNAEERRLQESR